MELVSNGGFEQSDTDFNAIGWNSTMDSTPIYFIDHEASQLRPARGGDHTGRVVSGEAGASIRIHQALTLCPEKSYTFSAYVRQPSEDSDCSIEFILGGRILFSLQPGVSWERDTEEYTAEGTRPEDLSVDLEIGVVCNGAGDSNGNRVIDLDDVSLKPNGP